ncbi:MAG: hypothetical protein GXY13_11390 [Acidimicrobiales bacterium]|nr:hypothetical protein [Acidimicrobiales bacterium]
MTRPRPLTALVLAGALLAAACGGSSDDDRSDATGDTAGPTPAAPDDSTPADPEGTDDDPAGTGTDYPTIRYAAHGPSAPNTLGPSCATGIEATSLDPVRVTAPADWIPTGSSGGTGPSEAYFDAGGARIEVAVAADSDDLQVLDDLVLGAESGEFDLAGTSLALVEASLGDATGYAMSEVEYVSSLPGPIGGSLELMVAVVSTEPDRPTLDEAVEVLSTVRVERCAAIQRAIIRGSGGGVLVVPEIVDDPLGKEHPGGEQPAYHPIDALASLTPEQLAYLLPLPEPGDRCAAESLQTALPPELPIAQSAFAPVQGRQQDALAALAEGC